MDQAPLIVPARVDDAGLDPWTFRALGHVARRAGEGGLYYGAGTRSAKTCRMSLRRWRDAIAELVRLGYLVAEAAAAGKPTVYRVETGAPRALVQEVHQCTQDTGAPGAPDQCTTCTPTGAPGAPKGVPLKGSQKEDGSRSAEASRPAPELILTAEVDLGIPRSAPSSGNGAGKRATSDVIIPEIVSAPGLKVAARLVRKGSAGAARPGWTAEAGEDWAAATEGVPNYGRIGKALGPLVERHGWATVRPAWQAFLLSPKRQYGPEHFAANFGDFLPGAADRKAQAELDDALAFDEVIS